MTIRPPNLPKSKTIGVSRNEPAKEDWRKKHPLFSLQYTAKGFCVADCDEEQKAAFASTLLQLGKRQWLDILAAGKHGSGSEKIPRQQMKCAIPSHVTPDQDFFTVVRFYGKCPMIGYVDKGVYYIVWLDRNHTCY